MTAVRLAGWMLLITIFGPLCPWAVGASNILVRALWRRHVQEKNGGALAAT